MYCILLFETSSDREKIVNKQKLVREREQKRGKERESKRESQRKWKRERETDYDWLYDVWFKKKQKTKPKY